MPWNESTRMDERRTFVEAYRSGLYEMAELCRAAGVSRPTGYFWLERYRLYGEAGLVERSHAVHHCPHRTASHLSERLLELRREHPLLGPAQAGGGGCSPLAARELAQSQHGRRVVAP